ncbi:MAG: hypothetical protein M3Y71_00645 [Actinomycetota bacterium]|nr:hypothetical protein [Actinomycetota bacterium]
MDDHRAAWRSTTADDPIPAIRGRACHHPCEKVGNRAELDGAVSMHAVERSLEDRAIRVGWAFTPSSGRTSHRIADPGVVFEQNRHVTDLRTDGTTGL